VWGRQLGQINLNFNGGEIVSWDGNPIFVDKNVEEYAAVTEKLAELKAPLDELKKQIIGKTTVNLDGKRATVRNQESNLGNLIADAVLWSTERDNTQVAMINGGGIRASIPEGDITIGQVMEVLPFGNRLVQIDLKGSDIVAAIENGISTIDADPEKSGGRFLQVAGLQFKADLSKPIGSRVTEIQIGNQKTGYKPLDTNVVYRVAILDFMFTGGDGFSMFSNGKNMRGGDVPEEQVVIDYIKAKSPVEPVIEGRIELTK
jgi:5'-nucleotidase